MVIKATLIVMDLALNVEPPVFLTRLKYECECPRSGLLHMFLSIQAQATLRFLGQNWVVVVRKLALNRSIVLKRGRFDILAHTY